MSLSVLITGAGSGFGKLTSLSLLKAGHRVFASMRAPEDRNKANADELRSAGAEIIEIDVTDENSVQSGIDRAIKISGGLDVVINNAGVGVIGIQENFTIADWQKLFDINLFGVQRVNRAVLPHMRKRKSGLIIYVTSLLGRMTIPFYGPYNASKWAMEAMAENYRSELSGLGIESCIIEPGGYPTDFMDRLIHPSDEARNAEYGDLAKAPIGFAEGFEKALADNPAQNPQDVADAVVHLISQNPGERAFRTVVDKMGMGSPLVGYNEQLEQITSGIYNAFGMGDMLKLNTK